MTVVEAGFKPIKTFADARLALHNLVLVLSPLLITLGLGTETGWAFWTGIVFGVIDPLVSFKFSDDGVRKVLYGLGAAVVAVCGVLSIGDPARVTTIVAAVSAAITAFIASFYTPSSVTVNPVV